jgi:hypothetical protein
MGEASWIAFESEEVLCGKKSVSEKVHSAALNCRKTTSDPSTPMRKD